MRRPFFQSYRSLWLFLPVVIVPVLLPSGETRSWYDIGRGWPWRYGWQPTDLRPTPLPRIESVGGFAGDLFVGIVAALLLWLAVRFIFLRRLSQQRLQRKRQPPWIWRHCPEDKRRYLVFIFTFLGVFAYAVCILAAMFGIILAPLEIASGHKGSLLEDAMRWYIHLFPKNSDGALYLITQICIAGVLFYLIGVFHWLKKQKQHEKSQQDKSDAA